MGRKKGFTLIELLVVIAIIAILAAILFPVFAQAREKARSTACLSNAKQIATAIQTYSDDYDEVIIQTIRRRGAGSQTPQERLWTTHIQPYVKSGGTFPAGGVFACPSFTEEKLRRGALEPSCGNGVVENAFDPSAIAAREVFAHYGMANAQLNVAGSGTQDDPYSKTPGTGLDPNTAQVVTVSLPQILRPAETALVSDGITMGMVLVGSTSRPMLSAFGCVGQMMHQEGCNYVFLDGHAKYLKGNPEQVVSRNSQGQYFMKYFTYDME